MSLNIKKLRVLWKEQLDIGNGEDIDFLCSFDDGKKWVSFKDVLADIRTPSVNGRRIPLASYEMLDDNYSAIDFTIPLTLNTIPGISDSNCSITTYDEASPLGLPKGEYYIKIASISTDFVGMNTSSSRVAAMSSLSKAKYFNITGRGDIDLAVQYDNGTRGLAVYVGKKTKLKFETTITEPTTHTAVFTKYKVDNFGDSDIPVELGSILGDSFITSMDSNSRIEKTGTGNIAITESAIDSFTINEKNKAVLILNPELKTGDKVFFIVDVIHYRLMYISNLTTKLIKAIEPNSSDPIRIDKRYPIPYSGKIRVNSEYIKYESLEFKTDLSNPLGFYELNGITRESITTKHEIGSLVFVSLLDGGSYGELPRKSISIYENTENLKQYFHFDSGSFSDTVSDMTGNNNGKIIGNVDFSNTESFLKTAASFNKAGVIVTKHQFQPNGTIHFYFKIEKMPENDMIIFGSEKGLRLKLSKDNLRLSVEHNNSIIVKSENPKLSKVKIGHWTEIAIAWQYSAVFGTNRLYLFKDGFLEADENFSITPGERYFAIGGLLKTDIVNDEYSNVEYSDLFLGKIDDWRIYDANLSLDQLESLDSKLKELGFDYCGIIKLDKRFVKKGSSPDKDTLLDYYLYDAALLQYEPYIIPYFSILKNDTENIDSLSQHSSICDLWPLYAIDNGNMFTPEVLENVSKTNKIQDQLILKSDGKYSARISYPINTDTIKYRFELSGKSDGVNSPIIKDFATIVSTSTIDF